MDAPNTYTAFDGMKLLCRGSLEDVVIKIKKKIGKAENSSILLFSDETGKIIDFNFFGNEGDVRKRLSVYVGPDSVRKDSAGLRGESSDSAKNAGPGRPKLGVTSREVSLLPRHWEWLATQPGGASATLRSLVEDAKKRTQATSVIKQAQERTYKFMSVLAGDLPNYEEALRALFKKEKAKFVSCIEGWPEDVKAHVLQSAKGVFEK